MILLVIVSMLMSGASEAAQSLAEDTETRYVRIDLASDIPGRAWIWYSIFKSPWGMASSLDGPWWIAGSGSGYVTSLTGKGVPFPGLNPQTIKVYAPPGTGGPATTTGVVYNGSGGFTLAPDEPAQLLFVTQEGTILGWNPAVDRSEAVPMFYRYPNAVYTGAAMTRKGGETLLYVANFGGGSVDIFDEEFTPVLFPMDAFSDPDIPEGFAPYNIQNINNELYVAFAMRGADGREAVAGSGLGYVDVFDTNGNLQMRLESGPWMDEPWSMALAPDDFGTYSGYLLVGNSGSGRIAAFDPGTGDFLGFLKGADESPITIKGLRSLGFGNGGTAGPADTLYFTASFGDSYHTHGLFGAITVTPEEVGMQGNMMTLY